MKTAKLRDEKEVLDRQQHADIEAQKNLEENLQQLHNRENELESQEEQMRTRLRKILDSAARHKDDLADLKKDLHTMKDKHRDVRLSIFSYFFYTDDDVCYSILKLLSLVSYIAFYCML